VTGLARPLHARIPAAIVAGEGDPVGVEITPYDIVIFARD